MPSSDVTITANYIINRYAISFNSNGGSLIEYIIQDYNSLVNEPNDPIREGYTFAGWYADEELTLEYSFSTMPAENIILHAKWVINQYTLSFVDYDGNILFSNVYNYGSDLSSIEVPAPLREGYSFDGWSQVVPTVMSASNITISALYIVNQYTISFVCNGGTSVQSITQDYNTVVIEPNNPFKLDYAFKGWYLDEELTIGYSFSLMLAENFTLYAKW